MGRLFLVRHGETSWNVEGRAQGHSDTPLSEVGRHQVGRVAARLAPVPFAAAYSSFRIEPAASGDRQLDELRSELHELSQLVRAHAQQIKVMRSSIDKLAPKQGRKEQQAEAQ